LARLVTPKIATPRLLKSLSIDTVIRAIVDLGNLGFRQAPGLLALSHAKPDASWTENVDKDEEKAK
jgi:hypothetical protein